METETKPILLHAPSQSTATPRELPEFCFTASEAKISWLKKIPKEQKTSKISTDSPNSTSRQNSPQVPAGFQEIRNLEHTWNERTYLAVTDHMELLAAFFPKNQPFKDLVTRPLKFIYNLGKLSLFKLKYEGGKAEMPLAHSFDVTFDEQWDSYSQIDGSDQPSFWLSIGDPAEVPPHQPEEGVQPGFKEGMIEVQVAHRLFSIEVALDVFLQRPSCQRKKLVSRKWSFQYDDKNNFSLCKSLSKP